MPRKTKQNKITTPELLEQINPENKRLMEDYLTYLKSIQRSPKTIVGYHNDLEIFFVWVLQNAGNKFFIKITKRDLVAYQNWLLNNNENSPARVRRLKSTISSLSNYIENVLDDEYQGYKPIVRKIENPVNQAVREKTVLEEEQCDKLLTELCRRKKYDKACLVALAMCSGRRKSELVRFKVSYFEDENIIYGSLYKTPEKIMTKGRGLGKPLTCYTLATKFKPYFDLWIDERKRKGIESEWLFPDKDDLSQHMNPDTINSWMLTCSKILRVNVYAHCFRHYLTTALSKMSVPDDIIRSMIGWESLEMVKIYKDITAEDEFGKYFDENGVKEVKQTSLADL